MDDVSLSSVGRLYQMISLCLFFSTRITRGTPTARDHVLHALWLCDLAVFMTTIARLFLLLATTGFSDLAALQFRVAA